VIDVDEIMKALSNPVRREILQWLKEPEKNFEEQPLCPLSEGVCVTRIFEKSNLCQSTVSTYLAMLQRAGLVKAKRIGQWTFYQRDENTIEQFLEQLDRDI
jgi:DNA-binding transcriptional ArsR family regulator